MAINVDETTVIDTKQEKLHMIQLVGNATIHVASY